ncbi:MAG TPA: hypothetical protein VF302_04250, partial [Candidatus Limnocylindrales bacterium]
MELVLLVFILSVVFVVVLLWIRADEVTRRQDHVEEQVHELQRSLAKIQRTAGKLSTAPTKVAGQPPEAASHEAAHAAPPAAWPRTAAVAPGPEAVPPRPEPARQALRGWVVPRETPPRPVYGPVMWEVPKPGARRGAGFVQRILQQMGLTPPTAGEGWSRATIEAWLEGRMLAVVGGIALLLGAVFFLSLAFSRGWITEPLRVLIGLVAGAGLLV